VESILNIALVRNKQQPTLSLRHSTSLFFVLGQRPIRNSSAEHEMFRIEGVIISRPALADMRSKWAARLVISIVVEVVRMVHRFLLLVLPFKVITPFFLE
jgi:hypothetical protein